MKKDEWKELWSIAWKLLLFCGSVVGFIMLWKLLLTILGLMN